MRRRKREEENQRRQELYLIETEKNERRLMIEERIRKLEEDIRIKNLGGRLKSTNRNNNINIINNNNIIRNNRRNINNVTRINNGNDGQDDIKKICNQLPEHKIIDINKISKEFTD